MNKQLSFHQSVILIHGARIGFFQGDIRLLTDDLQTLRPTVFPVVPRLLNRMCDKVRPLKVKSWPLHCCFLHAQSSLVGIFACFYLMLWFSSQACPKFLQIFSQANTPLKKWLLDLAFKRKIAELNCGLMRRDSIWDKLIFKKVQVDTATSGSTSFLFVQFYSINL